MWGNLALPTPTRILLPLSGGRVPSGGGMGIPPYGLMKKFVKLTLEFEFAILFKTYYYGRHDVRMKGW